MLVATQSYRPLSEGVKFLMVSVPCFTLTLPAGKGNPTLLQVTVGRGKPSAWQVTWKVVLCTGAACGGGTLVITGRPEIKKKKMPDPISNYFGPRWHLGKSSLDESKGLQITLISNGSNINSSHILVQLVIYSQTRSSVPVANKLMNSLMEKWFRLLIQ